MAAEIIISTNRTTVLKYTTGKSHSLQSKLTSPFPLLPDASSRPRTAVVFYLRSSARRRTQAEGYPRGPRAGPSRPARAWPPAATGGRPRPRGERRRGRPGRGVCLQHPGGCSYPSAGEACVPLHPGCALHPSRTEFDRVHQNLTHNLSEFKSSKTQGTLA